jgi:hypothetical protein
MIARSITSSRNNLGVGRSLITASGSSSSGEIFVTMAILISKFGANNYLGLDLGAD